jgi:hypothetical protein
VPNLDIGDFFFKLVVHKYAFFVFSNVGNIVVYKINVYRISQLFVTYYNIAIYTLKSNYSKQRFLKRSSKLRGLIVFWSI